MKKSCLIIAILFAVPLQSSIVHFPLSLDSANEVVFQVEAPDADRVMLAGSFNGWDKERLALVKDETGTWSCNVPLMPGSYEYKFVLNGEDWEPGENQIFEIREKDGRIILSGGKGFASWFDRKSNLLASDKIMLGLLYRYSLKADIGSGSGGSGTGTTGSGQSSGSLKESRHILELSPKIFINNSVFFDSVLLADYPNQSIPSLWRARLECRSDSFSLTVFNNERVLFSADALDSLKSFGYSSGYGVYRIPVSAYNKDVPEQRFGYNYQGIRAGLKRGKTGITAAVLKPMFGNFDLTFAEAFTKTGGLEIRAFGILQKGSYSGNEYPVPGNTGIQYWFYAPDGSGKLMLNSTNAAAYFAESANYTVLKTAGQLSYDITPVLKIFGAYAWKVKEGGYFIQSLQSDGEDLPSSLPDYGAKYLKTVNICNSSYHAEEFIVGLQPAIKHVFSSEIAWKHEDISFNPVFLKIVKPSLENFYGLFTAGESSKPDKSFLEILVSCVLADKRQSWYNYGIGFDENDFYGHILPGCHQKWTAGGRARIVPAERIRIGLETWFHSYGQRDIYFGQAGEWNSATFSVMALSSFTIVKTLEAEVGCRYKMYDYSDRIERDLFMGYRNDFFNPYAGLAWSPVAHVSLKFGWGLHPVNDEARKDGFHYLLNSFGQTAWPFFAEAEKQLSRYGMISVKGEILF